MITLLVGMSWGIAVGVVLTLWIALRYCGDLHQRLLRLETHKYAASINPTNAQLDRIAGVVFAEIAQDLAGEDDEFEDWDDDERRVTKH